MLFNVEKVSTTLSSIFLFYVIILLWHSPQLVALDLQWHGNVVGEEHACAQTLGHGDGGSIHVRGKLGYGV